MKQQHIYEARTYQMSTNILINDNNNIITFIRHQYNSIFKDDCL